MAPEVPFPEPEPRPGAGAAPLRRLGPSLRDSGRGATARSLLLPAFLLVACGTPPTGQEAVPPNIVLIVADDLGYNDVGFHGATEIETPHLDRLAHSGVTFTNGYVAAPTCGPSRAGLITGRYPARFGTDYNWPFAPFDTAHGLPVEELTLAKRLRRAGYRTGFVGKWHLGAAPPFQPLVRGFDSFFGFLGGNRDYFRAETSPGTRPDLLPLLDGWGATGFTGYLTDALTDQAVDFIESDSSLLDSLGERAPLLDRVVGLFHRRKRAPFLLVLSYNAPHDPLQAPPELIEKYAHIADEDRRAYLAMVDSLDQGVGRVLNALESTGQRSNTVVFFLSDNGGVYPTPGRDYLTWADNAPFRGGKTSFHEGGIRVPFVASWPARWPRGATFEPMVISLDIAATALGVAGVAVHPKPPLDGVDLDPFVRGAASGVPHEALFWRYWTPEGRYTGYAIRVGDRKLVRRHYGRDHELFDLGADPGETHDLSLEEPETVERLADRWNAWNRANPGGRFVTEATYRRELERLRKEMAARGESWGETAPFQIETPDDRN